MEQIGGPHHGLQGPEFRKGLKYGIDGEEEVLL